MLNLLHVTFSLPRAWRWIPNFRKIFGFVSYNYVNVKTGGFWRKEWNWRNWDTPGKFAGRGGGNKEITRNPRGNGWCRVWYPKWAHSKYKLTVSQPARFQQIKFIFYRKIASVTVNVALLPKGIDLFVHLLICFSIFHIHMCPWKARIQRDKYSFNMHLLIISHSLTLLLNFCIALWQRSIPFSLKEIPGLSLYTYF
jgi:hypothetical protein